MLILSFFFFTHPATTEIYTLSLHDALPIYLHARLGLSRALGRALRDVPHDAPLGPRVMRFDFHPTAGDRKSTRLNSSHVSISYAVFCLKKKKKYNVHNEIHNNMIYYFALSE